MSIYRNKIYITLPICRSNNKLQTNLVCNELTCRTKIMLNWVEETIFLAFPVPQVLLKDDSSFFQIESVRQ
jgi:hypothetical protein